MTLAFSTAMVSSIWKDCYDAHLLEAVQTAPGMEKIDVERVERELVSAFAADRKYSRENDAKIRAVNQRVATYDEFRFIKVGGAEGNTLHGCPVSLQRDCERFSFETTGAERH